MKNLALILSTLSALIVTVLVVIGFEADTAEIVATKVVVIAAEAVAIYTIFKGWKAEKK